MLYISSAQLQELIIMFLFPLARILGFCALAPVFGQTGIPRRVRLLIGIGLTLIIAPTLSPPPQFELGPHASMLFVMQILIGVAMGLIMRLSFAAVTLVGEFISMQMSLSLATAYDPQSGMQTPVLADVLNWITALIFLGFNGHLMMLIALSESFNLLPINQFPNSAAWALPAHATAVVFSGGIMLALPVLAALLVTNIALGMLTRAAPTLNLFSVGFPISMSVGFAALAFSLTNWPTGLEHLYQYSFSQMDQLLKLMQPSQD